MPNLRIRTLAFTVLLCLALVLPASAAKGPTLTLVSASYADMNTTGNNWADYPSVSKAGRFVAFASGATDLVQGGTTNWQVFRRDTKKGITELVSRADGKDGAEGDKKASPTDLQISADGRYVVFASVATNLLGGGAKTTSGQQIFLRDMKLGTTILVSRGPDGLQADGSSFYPTISADGRYVAFRSVAHNLMDPDPGCSDACLYVRDLNDNSTILASRADVTKGDLPATTPGDGRISPDGKFVVFMSLDANLTKEALGYGTTRVYIRNLKKRTTRLVSVNKDGADANGGSLNPVVSKGGRYVAFESSATDLTPDTVPGGGCSYIFVRDMTDGKTTLASVSSDGVPPEAGVNSSYPRISDDGQLITFQSYARSLTNDSGMGSGYNHVFLFNLNTHTTTLVSRNQAGVPADQETDDGAISPDGKFVAFYSAAGNFAYTINNIESVYLRSVP